MIIVFASIGFGVSMCMCEVCVCVCVCVCVYIYIYIYIYPSRGTSMAKLSGHAYDIRLFQRRMIIR